MALQPMKSGKTARAIFRAVAFQPALLLVIFFSFALGAHAGRNLQLLHASPLVTNPSIAIHLNLPIGHVGYAYSGSASASGGVAPYTFSVDGGALPTGLAINQSTGAITGTPTVAVISNVRIVVSDARGGLNWLHAQITVRNGGEGGISISVAPLSTTLLAGHTQQFAATVQGTSNTAVTWSASSGTISSGGLFTAPAVTSSTSVTITATSAANTSLRATATVTVSSGSTTPPPTVSVSLSPGTATVTSGNSQQFSATVQGTSNTAVSWAASAGTVSSAGMFTAPRVSASTNVSVTATSAADSTKKATATVAVTASPVASVSITTSSLGSGQSGSAYSYPISATGGSTPYQWNVAGGSLPQGFNLNSSGQLSGTTTQTGQFSFTVQVTDAGNSTASKTFTLSVFAPPPPPSSGSNYDGPAELPRIYMQTTMADTPAPGSTIQVGPGGSLQTALNSANCGDTIQLAAGAVFSGIFTFPAKACDDQHWIIVRTSASNSSLPPEGTRLTPCYAGVASLPGRPALNCSRVQNVLAQIIDPQGNNSGPIVFAAGANHYRLLGLEITRAVGVGIDFKLVGVQTSADHIVLDRVWLHGSPQDETTSGLGFSGVQYGALIDSYASDFHCTSISGSCTDSKVIGGGTGQTQDGPFKITGNFLEAAGENILFGGGGAAYTPVDIEIRHNHFFKPMTWKAGQPGFVGGASGDAFVVKNHLELKNAQRVLVEGNIFENSWGGFSQNGFSILLTPKNQAAGTTNICPLCQDTDVTIRYNTVSHVGTGISLADVASDNGGIATAGARYSIHDITVDDISASTYGGGGGLFQVLSGWPTNPLNNIRIDHVTAFPDLNSHFLSMANGLTNPAMYGFTFTNNIIGQTKYPVWNAGGTGSCAASNVPVTVLTTCFPAGYNFTRNAIIAGAQGSFPLSSWPTNNFYPVSSSSVQFVNFNNGDGGDYHLLSSSPYKNAGSDGKDLGADIDAILTATANVY